MVVSVIIISKIGVLVVGKLYVNNFEVVDISALIQMPVYISLIKK
jgi:hypothetical protein